MPDDVVPHCGMSVQSLLLGMTAFSLFTQHQCIILIPAGYKQVVWIKPILQILELIHIESEGFNMYITPV
jgi:hypothetical protein